jgi:sulfate adenylyltransferase
MTETTLISPYGGDLVNLAVPAAEADALRQHANTLPQVILSERNLCDLELMTVGGFSPLKTFMNQADYEGVVNEMRLADGTLWPMPIPLPIDDETRDQITVGGDVALVDRHRNILAVMTVEEMYAWDMETTAQKVFGTLDTRHPIVAEMYNWGSTNISGPLRVLSLPEHHDFGSIRRTPAEVREELAAFERENVVAFQTRNPMHRVHEELTKRAAEAVDGVLLLHPVVGMTKPGDVNHYTRVRTYKTLTEHYYEPGSVLLSLLPLAMRMGGPREAVWHAIIRRNYGANHFIVGRDHAGPGNDSQGNPIYGPYDAQDLVIQHEEELGVKMVPFKMLVYLPDETRYEEVDQVAEGTKTAQLSGTQVRENYLGQGVPLPDWFTRPEVAAILAEQYPPRSKQGFCVWFTGLSGAGKSTIAGVLQSLLLEYGRQSTLLDGDVVRTHLSKGLGFSKVDRDTNIRRIGFVASEIVRHNGVTVCAAISPYRATRNDVRNMFGEENFIEVFVDTPLGVCEDRDTKGLYAKARSGEIKNFTGIDDPYEEPNSAEVVLNTVGHTPEENARQIIDMLAERGFLRVQAMAEA